MVIDDEIQIYRMKTIYTIFWINDESFALWL